MTTNIAAAPKAGRREWIGLAAIALPGLVVVMDLTVLHLAVPAISADLKPSPSQLLWIVDIYGFLLSGSLVTMGTLGDRIGRRRLLLIGGTAFAAASVLAAFSRSAEMLIAARAILGIAGATLAPSTLSLIRNMFLDERERTVAVGLWVGSFAAGSALGPVVGGALIEFFWWGAVFLVPVPVMGLLLLLGPRLLPEFRDPNAGRLDIVSAALSVAAVLLAIYGLKLIAQDGLGVIPALSIAIGVVLGVLFAQRQRSLTYPLIDLRLFGIPVFSVTVVTLTLNAFVMFAASFFTAQYLQLVLGLSPLRAGLWTLPSALGVIASSQVAPWLVRRARPMTVMIGGSLLCAVGFAVLALAPQGGLPVLVAGSVIITLGAGQIATLANAGIVGAAPPERAGSAASISQTSVDFGGALGMALLGSVGVAVYRLAMAQGVPTGVSPDAALVARSTLGGAVAVARDLPTNTGALLLEAARGAFGEAYIAFAIVSAMLMVAAAAVLAIAAARTSSRR
jgi:DHA2 family multidrug resistance protein-like MFS transporter